MQQRAPGDIERAEAEAITKITDNEYKLASALGGVLIVVAAAAWPMSTVNVRFFDIGAAFLGAVMLVFLAVAVDLIRARRAIERAGRLRISNEQRAVAELLVEELALVKQSRGDAARDGFTRQLLADYDRLRDSEFPDVRTKMRHILFDAYFDERTDLDTLEGSLWAILVRIDILADADMLTTAVRQLLTRPYGRNEDIARRNQVVAGIARRMSYDFSNIDRRMVGADVIKAFRKFHALPIDAESYEEIRQSLARYDGLQKPESVR